MKLEYIRITSLHQNENQRIEWSLCQETKKRRKKEHKFLKSHNCARFVLLLSCYKEEHREKSSVRL